MYFGTAVLASSSPVLQLEPSLKSPPSPLVSRAVHLANRHSQNQTAVRLRSRNPREVFVAWSWTRLELSLSEPTFD